MSSNWEFYFLKSVNYTCTFYLLFKGSKTAIEVVSRAIQQKNINVLDNFVERDCIQKVLLLLLHLFQTFDQSFVTDWTPAEGSCWPKFNIHTKRWYFLPVPREYQMFRRNHSSWFRNSISNLKTYFWELLLFPCIHLFCFHSFIQCIWSSFWKKMIWKMQIPVSYSMKNLDNCKSAVRNVKKLKKNLEERVHKTGNILRREDFDAEQYRNVSSQIEKMHPSKLIKAFSV